MPLEFSCPACQSHLRLANTALAGKRIKCPMCGDVIAVPAEPAAAMPQLEILEPEILEAVAPLPRPFDASARPAARPPLDEEEGPARRRRYEEEEDEPRPRRRRAAPASSGGNSAVLWILLGIGCVLGVCGGGVVVVVLLINQARNNAVNAVDQMAKVADKANKAQMVQAAQEANKAQQAKQMAQNFTKKDQGKIFDIPLKGLNIQDRLAVGDLQDPTAPGCYCKIYRVQMMAGASYTIRMNAQDQKQLDTFLRLEDANFRELTQNDDAAGENTLNSRIDFFCNQTGVYRIIATSLEPNVVGNYTLLVQQNK